MSASTSATLRGNGIPKANSEPRRSSTQPPWRSTRPFCQGACGSVMLCVMPQCSQPPLEGA
eukprot:3142350-Alexandrium_andersonii.AAC.1